MQVARVTLQGPLTYTVRGRKFKKGQGVTITNPDDIEMFKANGAFIVSEVEVEKEKAKPAAKAKATTRKAAAK